MTDVDQNALTLLRPGCRYDSRFFVNTILGDNAAARLRVLKEDDGSPFIYAISYSPVAGVNRDDRTFEYFGETPPDILNALRNDRGLFVIDHSNEGLEAKQQNLSLLHARISALGIPPSRVMLLTQNLRFERDYESWLASKGADAPLRFHVEIYHCFLRQLVTFAENELGPTGELKERYAAYRLATNNGTPRPKKYLSLNFTPRGHRLATMLHIIQHGLLDKGHISFPGLANRKMNIAGRTEDLLKRQPFPDLDVLQTLLPELEAQPPRKLDTDPFIRVSPIIDVGQRWYYEESYFSLITESGVRSRGHQRFTEKPFKAVLGLHPFLIVGLPHTLSAMREYGFRTFAPLFDESYDSIEDDELRITTVLAEFRRLCSLSNREWAELSRDVLENVAHNFEQFSGPLQSHFKEKVEGPLLDRMVKLSANKYG